VRRYGLEDKVALLSRRLGLPVVTSFMGRGLLADHDAPLVGTYMGVAGLPEVTQLVEGSDGLFLLGEIICDTNFAVSETKIDMRKTIQALDGRVTLGYHSIRTCRWRRWSMPVAKSRRPETAFAVEPSGLSPRHGGRQRKHHADRHRHGGERPDGNAWKNADRLRHGRLPVHRDGNRHTALVAPGYYATMGYGVPAGLGLQAATGQRPLILVGDGAFQMTGWELGNCRRYGWDPIVLLFNNASWEMLRTFQPESGFNDLGHWGFAEMAAGMGGDGVRVGTRAELKAALDKAPWRRAAASS
jgi:indolepyruvate decarboxylase